MVDTVDLTVDEDEDEDEGSTPVDLTVETKRDPPIDVPLELWMVVASRLRGHRTACKMQTISRAARDGVAKSGLWKRLLDKRGLVDDPDDARHIKTRYARHVTEREDLLNDLGNIGDWETPSQETRQGWSIPYHISMAVHGMRRPPLYHSVVGNADWSMVINFEAPLAELLQKPEGVGNAAALLNYDTVLFSTARGLSTAQVVIVSAALAAVYTCVAKPFSRVILIVDNCHVEFALATCRHLLLEKWIVSVESIVDKGGSPVVVEIALRGSSALTISNFDCCVDVGAEMDATAAIEVDTAVGGLPDRRKRGEFHERWVERYDPDVLVATRAPALPYIFGVGGGIPFLSVCLDGDDVLTARGVSITSCIERVAVVTATETAVADETATAATTT